MGVGDRMTEKYVHAYKEKRKSEKKFYIKYF